MGCFSNFAVDLLMDEKEDHSYPSPERQLLWRLDDLKDRLEDLINKGASYRSGYIYTEDDIRYALPEHLDDICKVERAIELAKEDLLYKYGIDVYDSEVRSLPDTEAVSIAVDDNCEQMTMIEMIIPDILSHSMIAA